MYTTARTSARPRQIRRLRLRGPESSARGATPTSLDLSPPEAAQRGQRRGQRPDRHRPNPLDAVEQRALVLEMPVDVFVDFPVDGRELLVQRLEHTGDAAHTAPAGVLEVVVLGHTQVHQLTPARHQLGQLPDGARRVSR
jgi:hypothetical protein